MPFMLSLPIDTSRVTGMERRCQVEFTYVENVQSLPIAIDLQLIERPVRGQKVGGKWHTHLTHRRRLTESGPSISWHAAGR